MNKILNPKYFFQRLTNFFIVRPLMGLGFANYKRHYIHGPKDRLVLKNPKNVCLSNAILNTRSGKITIGEGVLLSHNTMVLTGTHNYAAKDVHKIWEVPEGNIHPIEIGDGTWVACGAIICGGVKIGKHCVIAAGSVVTEDVPDDCFVAGVPARVIRKIEKDALCVS